MAAMSPTRARALALALLALPAPPRDPKSPDDTSEDDDELDLPPLDGAESADEEGEAADDEAHDDDEEDLHSFEEQSEDPFDDATASDLETGLDLSLEDEGGRDDNEPAGEGVDVGALDEGLFIRDTFGEAADEKGDETVDEDAVEINPDVRGEDDGGVEGTEESVEDDVNEADLPGLDADEEGDFDGEDVVAEMDLDADAALPPWDEIRWTALEGADAAAPSIVAPTSAEQAPVIERLRGGHDGLPELRLKGDVKKAAQSEGSSLCVAAGGLLVAIADRRVVCISRDFGETFDVMRLPGAMALAFAGDTEEAPLLVLLAPGAATSASIALVMPDGSATRVAELPDDAPSADDDDDAEGFGPAAMEWDASREAVWIACRAGLFALSRAPRH